MSEILNLEKKYPLLFKTATYLKTKSPMFKNTIPKQMKNNFNFELDERICENGLKMSNNDYNIYCSNLNNLIDMSKEFLKLQKIWKKLENIYIRNLTKLKKTNTMLITK